MEKARLRLLHESYRKEDGRRASPQAEVYVAGRSFAAFQVEITPKDDMMLMLGNCYEDSIESPARARFAVAASGYSFQLYPVERVNGFADPLPDRRSVMLQKGEPVCLLAVARTGGNPGAATVYVVLYSVDEDGETVAAQTEMKLIPLEFNFPKSEDFVHKIDLWQHNTCIARYYGVEEYSNAHFALLENYVQALAWLGQKSVTIIASHTPWDGQRRGLAHGGPAANLFESQMACIEKVGDALSFDFSAIDRYIELCEKYGICDEYEVFGLCGAWTKRTLLRAQVDGRYVNLTDSEVDTYITALYRHFESRGYLEKTLICADEPHDMQRFKQEMARIRRLAPGFRFKAALDNPQFANAFDGDLHVIAPSFFTACSCLGQLRQLPIEKTWYICCFPNRPNTFISSPLMETRALAYMNEMLGFDGILRWAYAAWPEQPYQDGRVGPWTSGDTYLLYPGMDGRPVYSLRYYQLRRMAEDMQLLYSVQDKEKYIRSIWRILDPAEINWVGGEVQDDDLYSLDASSYDTCRLAMIEEIKAQA